MRKSGDFSSHYFSSLFLVFLFLFISDLNLAKAQSFDYQTYPKLDFDFKTLTLDLGIQPQNLRIDGAAKYEIEANISGADTLTLYSAHIDISSVTVDGAEVEYSLHNDALFIPVDDSTEAGNTYTVNILYSCSPQFVLLKIHNGTVWTSLLPKTQRHWVPIVDNPNVSLKTVFNIAVPSGFDVRATGKKMDKEVVSVDVMRYRFETENEVPASGLSMAIGKFKNASTQSGSPKINIATEQAAHDSLRQQKLLQAARKYVAEIEETLQMEYPFSQLDVIVTEDHNWETKSWGASTINLYLNNGSLETQLKRGILGQWFGVYHREATWQHADALTLYQTLVMTDGEAKATKLDTAAMPQNTVNTIYDQFGTGRWNKWQDGLGMWQDASFRKYLLTSAAKVLEKGDAVIYWRHYADFWYQQTGQPLMKLPHLMAPKKEQESTSGADSVAYKVTYDLNEAEGQLKLHFEATHGKYTDLTTITAREVYPNKTDESEVTFTGATDSVVLQISPMISTLQLTAPNHPELTLDENKPAPFLIYELRNGETAEERAKAAGKLGIHNDNPDLQLAIKDFMNRDIDIKVRAALLRSLGEITGGAKGTEQMFLKALRSEKRPIRDAALMALQHYQGNESVVQEVKAAALGTDDETLFRKATKVLTALLPKAEFAGYAESIVRRDTVGESAIFVIQELANMGAIKEATDRAALFITDEFRYNIRQRALQVLIQHDHTPSDWLNRAKELFKDPDPRIRFLAVRGLERNINSEIISYLPEYQPDEYDARVAQKIDELLQ